MLTFDNTVSVPEFIYNYGINTIFKMTLENGRFYLLSNNGISIKASEHALSVFKSGMNQYVRISKCTDDESEETFFMMHLTKQIGTVTDTFTF